VCDSGVAAAKSVERKREMFGETGLSIRMGAAQFPGQLTDNESDAPSKA
jgi:hypothetical protein